MDLASYLTTKKQKPSAFAAEIGRSHTTVLRWLDGSMSPSPQAVRDVFAATNGQVTASDMFRQEAAA